MKTRTAMLWAALAALLLFGLALSRRAPVALASPQGQATKVPTDEPTKAPYVFPVPVFIGTPGKNPPLGENRPPVPKTPLPTLPAAQPISIQAGGERTYVVASGDSAWIIAQKAYGNNYGYMYDLILKANGLTATSKLQIGQVLKIPALPGSEPLAAPTSAATRISATSTPDQALTSPTAASSKKNAVNSGSSGPLSTSRYELALMALNLLSGILLTGSGVFGFLSYTMYQRARRLEKITMMTRRIRAY